MFLGIKTHLVQALIGLCFSLLIVVSSVEKISELACCKGLRCGIVEIEGKTAFAWKTPWILAPRSFALREKELSLKRAYWQKDRRPLGSLPLRMTTEGTISQMSLIFTLLILLVKKGSNFKLVFTCSSYWKRAGNLNANSFWLWRRSQDGAAKLTYSIYSTLSWLACFWKNSCHDLLK